MHRAQCFYAMGKYEDCIKDYDTAIKLKQNDPFLLQGQGLAYFATGKYKKCIKFFKLALKNRPYRTFECDIYYHIGLAYSRVEKFEKSIFPFTYCVNKISTDIRFIHERAKSY
jgi:tetratricopeptide (TPR) repeat protein